MNAVRQVSIASFAKDQAKPGQRYRARIGGGRIVEIQDDRVFEGERKGGVRCLSWSQKRIVAIEEIENKPKNSNLIWKRKT